jgi:Tol biopolymer transport system component/imidazolonepropionase-like amidohydrolase
LAVALCLAFALPASAFAHPEDHEAAPDTTSKGVSAPDLPKSGDPWDVNVPHGPADTLKFETSEGTWMALDVSPDGHTIVFGLLGDLYTMPVAGGTAKRLTSGMAWDHQPRWSPDGKKIAFTTDRSGTENVWMMDADGKNARPVTREANKFTNSPAWSPDGEWIVVRRRLTDNSSLGTVEVWMYSVLGGSGVQITKKAEWGDANEPVFSPDGRYVYFSGRPQRFNYDRNVHQGIWQVRRYDRSTGRIITLTDGAGGSAHVAFRPDGRMFSFVRRVREKTVLFVYDLSTERERALWNGLSNDNMEGFAWTGVYPNYAWTPDGSAIVVYAAGGFWRVEAGNGHATRIPFKAQVEQVVTHAVRFPQNLDPEMVKVKQIAWPSLSPDGKTLVFSAIGRIWSFDVAAKKARALTPSGQRAFSPSWSPDGKSIAYVTWQDTVGGHVMRMGATGGSPTRLTRIASHYLNPVWSRDGSKVAFLHGSGGPLRSGGDTNDELWYALQWMPASGGEPKTVITLDAQYSAPSMPRPTFNVAGDRLYFVDYGPDPTGTGQKNSLVSVRLDGTDRIEHANITNAEDLVVSPDERWVAYRMKYAAYVSELPRAGREPVELGVDGALPARKLAESGGDWMGWSRGGRTITWSAGPVFRSISMDSLTAYWEKSMLEAGKPKTKTNEKSAKADSAGAKADSSAAKKKDEAKAAKSDGPKPDSLYVRVEVPRMKPNRTVAFVGARVLTMRNGDEKEVIEDATVIVKDDRIVAVGPHASTPVPAGAKSIDARGKTIMPGIVDVHAHAHYASSGVIPNHFWSYDANLAYGVTTMHDPSATSWEVFTESEMVQAGELRGPRVFSTGNIIYGAGGREALPLQSLDEARTQLRRMKALGAISVKSYMQPRREQRQWILQAAREESMLVVPEGGGKFEENLGMVMDGHTGVEHALPVTPIFGDVVKLFSSSQSGYTPTLLVAYGGLSGENWFYQHYDVFDDAKLLRFTPREVIDARSIRRGVMAPEWDWHHMAVAAGAKKIVDAGGHVQLGAHGQRQGLGAHWEMWALAQGGMTPGQVIKCATWNGAWYLGMDKAIGSVEKGKLADFVVLDKNPLEDIHNTNTVRWTVKNGDVFDGNTLAKQ